MKLLTVFLCSFVLAGCVTYTPINMADAPSEKLDRGAVRFAKKVALKGFTPEATEVFEQYGVVDVVGIESGDYDFLIERTLFKTKQRGIADQISYVTTFLGLFTLSVFPVWEPYDAICAFSVKDKDGNLVVQYAPGNSGVNLKNQTSYSFVYLYTYQTVTSIIPVIPLITGKPSDRARKDTSYKLNGALLTDMQKRGLL